MNDSEQNEAKRHFLLYKALFSVFLHTLSEFRVKCRDFELLFKILILVVSNSKANFEYCSNLIFALYRGARYLKG